MCHHVVSAPQYHHHFLSTTIFYCQVTLKPLSLLPFKEILKGKSAIATILLPPIGPPLLPLQTTPAPAACVLPTASPSYS